MLDAKVLAAVFASLTAVATTMNGGAIQPDMAVEGVSADTSDISKFSGLNIESLDKLKSLFTTRPEPTTQVSANLTVTDLEDETINVQNSSIQVADLKKVSIGPRKVSSDSEILFKNFKGSVKPGDPTNIQGTARSVSSSGVNITGSLTVSEKVNATKINIDEKGRAKIKLSDIKGQINSDSASTEFEDSKRDLSINSFTGEITVYPNDKRLVLDGKVDRLTSGQFSFGG